MALHDIEEGLQLVATWSLQKNLLTNLEKTFLLTGTCQLFGCEVGKLHDKLSGTMTISFQVKELAPVSLAHYAWQKISGYF